VNPLFCSEKGQVMGNLKFVDEIACSLEWVEFFD